MQALCPPPTYTPEPNCQRSTTSLTSWRACANSRQPRLSDTWGMSAASCAGLQSSKGCGLDRETGERVCETEAWRRGEWVALPVGSEGCSAFGPLHPKEE